jgi:hypothetical protein
MKKPLKKLVDFLMGGEVPERPRKPLPEVLFLPVLFANGRDDDGEAVRAFLENRPFIFQGQVIAPGVVPSSLQGLVLTFSAHGIDIDGEHGKGMVGFPGGKRLKVAPRGPLRQLRHCTMGFGAPVQP